MGKTAHGNEDLLILGGAGLLAILLFSGVLKGGSGGTGTTETPLYGSGETSPTIYQFPAEGGVTFPSGDGGLDLAGLLALLGGGAPPAGGTETVTKKEAAVYDAGDVLPDGTVLKKPFVSSTYAPAAAAPALKSSDALFGLSAGLLSLPGFSNLAGPLAGLGLSLNVLDFAGAAITGTLQSKKSALAAEGFGPEGAFGAGTAAIGQAAAAEPKKVVASKKSYADYNTPLYDTRTGELIGYVGQDAKNLATHGEAYEVFDTSGAHFTDTPAGGTWIGGSPHLGQGAPEYGSAGYQKMIANWELKGWLPTTKKESLTGEAASAWVNQTYGQANKAVPSNYGQVSPAWRSIVASGNTGGWSMGTVSVTVI